MESGGMLVLASVLNMAPEEGSERSQNKGAAFGGTCGLSSGGPFGGHWKWRAVPWFTVKVFPLCFLSLYGKVIMSICLLSS